MAEEVAEFPTLPVVGMNDELGPQDQASENAVNLVSDGWIAKPQRNSFAPGLHTEVVTRGNVELQDQ
eukprot:6460007-Amphidinium_carterae.2